MAPDANVTGPAASVPTAAGSPGISVPPELTVIEPTVPMPSSVPPPFTAMLELIIVPFAASVPPLIVQGSAAAFVPIKVQVELPILLNAVKPRYCWAAPMLPTLKVSAPVPPSWSTSPPVPSTFPLMIDPGPSVRVNGPEPGVAAKLIAVPPVPVMVPELNTLPFTTGVLVPVASRNTIPARPVMLPVLVTVALLSSRSPLRAAPEMLPALLITAPMWLC